MKSLCIASLTTALLGYYYYYYYITPTVYPMHPTAAFLWDDLGNQGTRKAEPFWILIKKETMGLQ